MESRPRPPPLEMGVLGLGGVGAHQRTPKAAKVRAAPPPSQAQQRDVEEAISVTIRLRPLAPREIEEQGGQAITPWQWTSPEPSSPSPSSQMIFSEDDMGVKRFTFDRILAPEATNEEAYNSVAKRIVQTALSGINATVFACESVPLQIIVVPPPLSSSFPAVISSPLFRFPRCRRPIWLRQDALASGH